MNRPRLIDRVIDVMGVAILAIAFAFCSIAVVTDKVAGIHMTQAGAQLSGGGIAKIFTDGSTICGSGTNASHLRFCGVVGTDKFGDGTDGTCHFDGTSTVLGAAPFAGSTVSGWPSSVLRKAGQNYNLVRDIYCSTIVVDNNVFVETQGFRVFASVSVTLNGNAEFGAAGFDGFGGSLGGQGGIGPASGILPGNNCAGVGGGGSQTNGAGVAPGSANRPLWFPATSITNAGNGGAGSSGIGGTSSLGAFLAATSGDIRNFYELIGARTTSGVSVGGVFPCGGGGGGDGTHYGGGGGGDGAWAVIASPVLVTNSTSSFVAYGGGGGGGDAAGDTGGGGGGTGGVLVIVHPAGTSLPTTHVNGGAGGAGHGMGTNGTAGNDGVVKDIQIGVAP